MKSPAPIRATQPYPMKKELGMKKDTTATTIKNRNLMSQNPS